LVCKS
jgi:hypothetical protein